MHDTTASRLSLAAVIAVWAPLALYNLGAPSLFWEEILVSLTAKYPLHYIYQWSSTVEIHPPLYHFFTKAVLFFGDSEFALRLPSVVFAALSLVVGYCIIKPRTSHAVALVSVSLMAVSPVFLEYARKQRPYALILLLFLLSLYFLLRYVQTFKIRPAIGLLLCNLLLVWTQYISYIIFLAQAVCIAACLAANLSREKVKIALALFLGMCLVVASNFNMFYATVLNKNYFESGKLTVGFTLTKLTETALGLITYTDIPLGVSAALLLAGLVVLFFRDRLMLLLTVSFCVVPVLALGVARANWSGPSYVIFMLPLMTTAMASALCLAVRGRLAALAACLAIVLASAYCILGNHHGKYYEADSYSFGVNRQRDYAQALNALPPGTLPMFCSESLRNAVSWYTDKAGNPSVSAPALGPGAPALDFALVVNEDSCASFTAERGKLLALFGQPASVRDVGGVLVYHWRIKREPTIPLGPERVVVDLPAAPQLFYTRVHELTKVNVNAYWDMRVIPTANQEDTSFSYRFRNEAGAAARDVTLDLGFHNQGVGNVLKFLCAFDNEPFREVLCVAGPSDMTHRQVTIGRNMPFTTFTVKAVMNCSVSTPQYPGNNLATVGVGNIRADFGPTKPAVRPVRAELTLPDRLPGDLRAVGLGELGRTAGRYYRWGLGPESLVSLTLAESGPVRVSLGYLNFIPGQAVEITANGQRVASLALPEGASLDAEPKHFSFDFPGVAGENTIRMRYAFWNLNLLHGKPARYLEGADAPVALYVTSFGVELP